MIKVIIAEHSDQIRRYLFSIVEAQRDFTVAGTAKDGEQAVNMVRLKNPDIVVMDIHMPRMDGCEATKRIMAKYPVPIVIMSSDRDHRQIRDTFRALQEGAIAKVKKPEGPFAQDSDLLVEEFFRTLKLTYEIKVVRRRFKDDRDRASSRLSKRRIEWITPRIKVVAIGASTGGPAIIKTILVNMSKKFPAPLLIVQHISAGYIQGMVNWLSTETSFPVKLGEHGERAEEGHIYFAPDDFHMGITSKGEISLKKSLRENGLRPSIAYLFRSVAEVYGNSAMGVLLSGMGKDGALELKRMRDNGCLTIVQDKASSVVYGMPGEAVKMRAADKILNPEQIAIFLNTMDS